MIELNTIYQEDCRLTMSKIPDGVIDLVITSPPYNLGKKHHTGNKSFDAYDAYDDNLPEAEYQSTQISVLSDLYRVVKDTGSLLYNHKNRIRGGVQISPYEWIFKTDWVIKQEIVWFNRSQNFDKIRFYPMTERIYWLTKSPKTKLINNINHHDVFGRDEWRAQGTDKKHKRSFPVKMVEDLIKCFPEAQLCYDPYMGSGTVAIAAKKAGIDYIGSEISANYCEISKDRLAKILEEK
jgi:site-specific DNA-methyltransferase (adenine-specific)